jgi:hypothetical protein
MAKMRKSQVAEMKEFFNEMDAVEGMESIYSGDVDMPGDVPLIENLSLDEDDGFSDEEEYTEEEIEAFLENVDTEGTGSKMSFDEMMPQKFVETGIKFQQKENIVTPHYLVIRELVEKTPSVCHYKDCMYDSAKAIGYKNWHRVPKSRQRIALAALQKHNQDRHKFRNNELIDKSEIPTHYLSPTL